jgi:hypothetical protein
MLIFFFSSNHQPSHIRLTLPLHPLTHLTLIAFTCQCRSTPPTLDYARSHGYPYPEGPQVMAFYPQFYHKTDREGRPIYIEQLGKLDTSKLAALTNQDRQLHHLVDEYEKFLGSRLPATSKVTGGLVETSCTILDLTNAGISTFYKGESESKLRMSSERRV